MDQIALIPFSKETNLFMLLRQIQNAISTPFTLDYYNSIPSAINSLRTMNKYHNDLFTQCFDNIIDRFHENLLSEQHSDMFILGLALVKDIFSSYNEDFNDNWITVLMPSLTKGLVSLNKAIQSLTLECFELLSRNMLYTSTINSLIELVYTHNDKIIISTAINGIKQQWDVFPVITLINSVDWNEIIANVKFYDASYENRQDAKLLIKDYFIYLKQLIDKESQWNEFVDLLTDENKQILYSMINLIY